MPIIKIIKYICNIFLYFWESALRLIILKSSNAKEKFTLIYKYKYWSDPFSNRSVSGYGSDDVATKNVIPNLESFFKENKISTILDIPCGDFKWMQNIDLNGINYIGADIVEDLIKKNQSQYFSGSISFKHMDIINDTLPQVDLVLVRDCFIHLSNDNVRTAIINIIDSDSKFIATTTFIDEKITNNDITTGDFRFINLLNEPFNLPQPFKLLNDSFVNKEKIYSFKRIGIWEVSKLKNYWK